jgi:hypothetical protein
MGLCLKVRNPQDRVCHLEMRRRRRGVVRLDCFGAFWGFARGVPAYALSEGPGVRAFEGRAYIKSEPTLQIGPVRRGKPQLTYGKRVPHRRESIRLQLLILLRLRCLKDRGWMKELNTYLPAPQLSEPR